MTVAGIGFGSLLKVSIAGVYTTIGEQHDVTPPGVSVDSIDATHEESSGSFREFIPGLKDGGEVSFELHYVPTGTAEEQLYTMLGTTQLCRSVFPSGAYASYSAFITSMEPETPIDDKMVMSVTLKVTGQPTRTPASAPSNSVLPSIAGIPQVGVELTADVGVWANEPTSFTYQWKLDTVNIAGETSATYTPVIGDIAGTLTVVVTGTNSAGSASATSAGAIDVIAA